MSFPIDWAHPSPGEGADPETASSRPDRYAIERQLDRILADPIFRTSQRLSRFLRFVVHGTLAGRVEQLKEYTIGLEVFDLNESYNPQENPIVRIMAGRLRGKLAEYYLSCGLSDPVFIEIPKGGYTPRFVGRDAAPVNALRPGQRHSSRDSYPGRDHELNQLWSAFSSVSAGTGAMWMISGEAGMGKTTLGEMFLSEIRQQSSGVWIGCGTCSERLAETDAYVPILEALHTLLQSEAGNRATEVMKSTAPTWYLQLAPLDPGALSKSMSPSHERMRREIVDFLEELSSTGPIVLFLDDLHWADGSTCELLGYLGARIANRRVLVVMTYRTVALASTVNPFLRLKLDLEHRALCRELPLPFLSLHDIEQYVSRQFPANRFPAEFARVVQERTEGNPLFMTGILRFFRDQGVLIEQDGVWTMNQSMHEASRLIPTGINSLIRLKLARVSPDDLQLLTCASVQGVQFDSSVIAQALGRRPADVEERLQELETAHNFVQLIGAAPLPNHSLSRRYRFVHVFYQNALYAALTPSRRAEHSEAVARALVALTGAASRTVAADLAMLFEAAQDDARAAEYFQFAAANAARLFAYPETVILAERGLAALARIPGSPRREGQELRLLLILSMALMVTRGYGAPEVEKAHRRALELSLELNENRRLMTVLWGLHTCEVNAGNLQSSLKLAEQMRSLVEASPESAATLPALHALGTTLGFMGKLGAARDALERIFCIQPVSQHSPRGSLYLLDPCVTSLSMLARVLAFMGFFDRALEKAAASLEFANRLGHPQSITYATFWVGWVHHARGEYERACQYLEPAMAMCSEYGLAIILEWGRVVRGSALAQMGRLSEGIAEMRQSLRNQQTMRSLLERPYCLTLLAEALGRNGATEEALALCEEALELGRRTDGRCYEPETHRVRAGLMLAAGSSACAVQAELKRALHLARENENRLLELRVAISYLQFQRNMGDIGPGRTVLAESAGWFTEEAGCPVVAQAHELLVSGEE